MIFTGEQLDDMEASMAGLDNDMAFKSGYYESRCGHLIRGCRDANAEIERLRIALDEPVPERVSP